MPGLSSENTFLKFEENDFYLDIKDVTIGQEIGRGQFSTVYLGSYFGDIIAVKKQTRQAADLEKYLLRELAVLNFVKHENMLVYIGAFNEISSKADELNAVYIITEYAEGGDLLHLILSSRELGWKFKVKIARDAAAGLSYLHSKNLIHRDIKSSNLLLDHHWRCKISDFGFTREVTSHMSICGTDEYMAPELFFDADYGISVDVFSFGIVLVELLARKKIGENFLKRLPSNNFVLDEEELRGSVPLDSPNSLVELTVQCCDYEEYNRPESQDVLVWIEELINELPDDSIPSPQLFDFPALEINGLANLSSLNRSTSKTSSTGSNSRSRERELGSTESKERQRNISNLSEASTLQNDVEYENQEYGVLLSGFLYQRNKIGFRNWKKRWFVLTKSELKWFQNEIPAEMLANTEPKGIIPLAGCYVSDENRQFRWRILNTENMIDLQDTRLDHRELAASNVNQKKQWIKAIKQAITLANEIKQKENMTMIQQETQFITPLSKNIGTYLRRKTANEEITTVSEWLDALNLEEYSEQFKNGGFNDLQKLYKNGLSNEDLNQLGIVIPLHKRVLQIACEGKFQAMLQVSIPSYRDFTSVCLFKVVSQWRMWHSSVFLRYSDFNFLHNRLKQAMRENGDDQLFNSFPKMPTAGPSNAQQRSETVQEERRRKLQNYLIDVAHVIQNVEPYFQMILEFLEFIPPQGNIEENNNIEKHGNDNNSHSELDNFFF